MNLGSGTRLDSGGLETKSVPGSSGLGGNKSEVVLIQMSCYAGLVGTNGVGSSSMQSFLKLLFVGISVGEKAFNALTSRFFTE